MTVIILDVPTAPAFLFDNNSRPEVTSEIDMSLDAGFEGAAAAAPFT